MPRSLALLQRSCPRSCPWRAAAVTCKRRNIAPLLFRLPACEEAGMSRPLPAWPA